MTNITEDVVRIHPFSDTIMATSVVDAVLSASCAEAVAHLLERKINFLALDFDQTIIDIHTSGSWKGNSQELAEHIRPMFHHLIAAAHTANIKIAIVTFSPQVRHISEVLDLHFPGFSHEIVIRGRDKTWSYEGNGTKEGKQHFLASAAEEFQIKYDIDISKSTTLLIDDDPTNIRMTLKDGVRGILLNPKKSHLLLNDILRMP